MDARFLYMSVLLLMIKRRHIIVKVLSTHEPLKTSRWSIFLLYNSTLDRSLWVTRSICKYMLERWHSHFSTKEVSMQYYGKGKKSTNLVWHAWQYLRLKNFCHKLHLLSNKSFCKSPKPSNVKRRSRKNTQVPALTSFFHTNLSCSSLFCRPVP